VASNRYWILDDQAGQFDTWSSDPHALSNNTHLGSRRYFFGTDTFLKHYRFNHPRGAHNKTEFEREKKFIQNPAPGFIVPASPIFYENSTEGWLVTERMPGRLLLDLLIEGEDIDHRMVLLAVLAQLSVLEAAGLYHNDIRTWNLLVTEDGTVHLIDYGSITSKAQDCVWPGNLFLAFFIFVREVATGVVDAPDPLRTVSISPFGLPQPYREWAMALWRLPLSEWSFQLMHETLLKMPIEMSGELAQQPIEEWMKATEEAIQTQILFTRHVVRQRDDKIQEVETRAREAQAKAQEAHAKAQETEARAGQAEAKAQEAFAKAQEAEARAGQAEAKAQEANAKAQEAEARAGQAEAKVQVTHAKAQETKVRAGQAETKAEEAHAKAQEAETRAGQAEAALAAIHNSRSWRITAPLRVLGRIGRRKSTTDKESSVSTIGLKHGTRAVVVFTIKYAGDWAQRSPGLKRFALRLLWKHPGLKQKLRSIYLGSYFDDQSHSVNLSGPPSNLPITNSFNASEDKEYLISLAAAHGINAQQRSPLEANFHNYRE
jgi:O-antigen chain-terminating methyltransferase